MNFKIKGQGIPSVEVNLSRGEGLFLTKLTGPGKVILQIMNMNEFALRVGSYIPTGTN